MRKLKKIVKYLVVVVTIITILFTVFGRAKEDKIPSDFVNIKDVVPSVHVELRYASNYNVTGKRVDGLSANSQCYVTKQTAQALKKVQQKLAPMDLSLKLYDCYRPQKSTDAFIRWEKSHDQSMKHLFPDVDKSDIHLFERSPKSRGSSVSVAIVDAEKENIKRTKGNSHIDCTAPFEQRRVGNSLDFGTSFSCLSPKSHLDNMDISPQARANRLLLKDLMKDAGFIPDNKNWWSFSLKNEPYRNTYFDFDV